MELGRILDFDGIPIGSERIIVGSGAGWHEKVVFAVWPQFRIIVKTNRDTVAHFEWCPNTGFVWPSLIVFSLCFAA